MITGERLLECAEHLPLVGLVAHVDEVDNDDSPEIAQAELSRDGLGRFEVRLEDRLVEVAMPDESTSIDVDGGHRLRLIDHDVPARFELHLAVQGFLDLVLHRVQLENGSFAGVELDARAHLG